MGKIISRMVPNASNEKMHIKSSCGYTDSWLKEYNYRCSWCGRLTNSDFVAYTTEGPIDHLCWNCRNDYQMDNQLNKKKRRRKRK